MTKTTKLVQKSSPILHKKAREVPASDITSPRIRKIIANMKKELREHSDGVAIAAPQIGEDVCIFVVSGHIFDIEALTENDKSDYKDEDLVFINPRITKSSRKKQWLVEGCLSVRWVYGEVRRAEKVTVEAIDEHGEKFTRGASGLLAQIFQHEIDHLEGHLFTEKARNVQEIPPNQEQ